MSRKNKKFEPILIVSKEGLIAAVNQAVSDKLEVAALQVEMEQEIAGIQAKYQKKLEPLLRAIGTSEAGIQVFVQQNREALLPLGLKSLDLQLATLGFRNTPHRCEKARSKDTFDEIALRLAFCREFGEDGEGKTVCTFNGEDYVNFPDPQLDKNALLANREKIPASVLKTIGLRFESDELFYFEPKSEVIEGKTEAAA